MPVSRAQPGNVQVTDLSRFARIDLDTLPGILAELEKLLAPDVLRGLNALLGEKTDLALVVRSVFEVNMICQLRMMASVWRAKGKEWPRGIEEQRPQNDEHLWEALDSLRTGNPERAMEKVDHFVLRAPKNFQPRVLLGFMAMERDELKRAGILGGSRDPGLHQPAAFLYPAPARPAARDHWEISRRPSVSTDAP
jgi:hypothetical protein